MVLEKINKFLYVFMLAKTGQEKEFCNFVDRNLAFLDYKNNDLKKSKNFRFSKGVSPWFSPKIMKPFYFFFLGNLRQKKVIDTFYIKN